MDKARFDSYVHSVKNGGIPSFENEKFTKEQKSEMEDALKERSKISLDTIKTLKLESANAVPNA